MEVYLIRHTTVHIKKGICYGQSEVPLADTFAFEVEKMLKKLPNSVDAVYSSPLARCYKLAKRIKAKKIAVDKRILEMNFGDWEMKKWDEIDQITLDVWMKNFVAMRVPGGENFIDLRNRVRDFITDLTRRDYRKVAVVTHGGVIRCFVAQIRGIPLKDAFTITADYSSITKIVLQKNTVNNTYIKVT